VLFGPWRSNRIATERGWLGRRCITVVVDITAIISLEILL
jgi:hypothetical protein